MVNNHGDRKSPKDRVGLDPFQMAFLWLINGGYLPLTNWDDPPSSSMCHSPTLAMLTRVKMGTASA